LPYCKYKIKVFKNERKKPAAVRRAQKVQHF